MAYNERNYNMAFHGQLTGYHYTTDDSLEDVSKDGYFPAMRGNYILAFVECADGNYMLYLKQNSSEVMQTINKLSLDGAAEIDPKTLKDVVGKTLDKAIEAAIKPLQEKLEAAEQSLAELKQSLGEEDNSPAQEELT